MDIQDGNHGTLQNGATFAPGLVGQAFSFDGIDDYFDYGAQANLNFAGAFTIEGWVKTTASGGVLFSQRRSTLGAPMVWIGVGSNAVESGPGRLGALVRDDAGSEFTLNWARVLGGLVNDGNWHSFALTRNGGTIELFLDGVSQGVSSSVESDGPITTNLRSLATDRYAVQVGLGGQYLRGSIDEVSIYNRALTSTEIRAIYNAGSAGKCKGFVPSGSFAQVASGAGWQTALTLINLSATRVTGLINFYGDNGNPLTLPLLFPQSGSTVTGSSANFSIDPNASFVVESEASSPTPIVGWADIQATGTLQGYLIFRQRIPGVPDSEGTVPVDAQASSSFILPYDNTSGFQTGVALANQSASSIPVSVILRDDSGNQLGSSQIILGAFGHTSFYMNNMFAQTALRRGTAEFRSASANITGVGLRFSPTLSFTSVPVIK